MDEPQIPPGLAVQIMDGAVLVALERVREKHKYRVLGDRPPSRRAGWSIRPWAWPQPGARDRAVPSPGGPGLDRTGAAGVV